MAGVEASWTFPFSWCRSPSSGPPACCSSRWRRTRFGTESSRLTPGEMPMRLVLRSSVQALALLGSIALPAVAQERVPHTHTTGLFLGYGTEANVVTSQPGAPSSANEHVVGRGAHAGIWVYPSLGGLPQRGMGRLPNDGREPHGCGVGRSWCAIPFADGRSCDHAVSTGRTLQPYAESGWARCPHRVRVQRSVLAYHGGIWRWRQCAHHPQRRGLRDVHLGGHVVRDCQSASACGAVAAPGGVAAVGAARSAVFARSHFFPDGRDAKPEARAAPPLPPAPRASRY